MVPAWGNAGLKQAIAEVVVCRHAQGWVWVSDLYPAT